MRFSFVLSWAGKGSLSPFNPGFISVSPPLRILIITPWYPYPAHPQHGNFVREQADWLARAHRVEVVTVFPGARAQVRATDEESGVKVVQAEYPADGPRLSRISRRAKAWKQALSQRTLTPDLIHAHVLIDGGVVARRLARELRVPLVITAHSHRWLHSEPPWRIPERWLARRAARAADRVLPVSPSLQRGMKASGIRADYFVLPNLTDTERFHPAPPAPGRPFTFLHVSDFSDNKNVGRILVAFGELLESHPDARLVLAGNGDHAQLREWIRAIDSAGQNHRLTDTVTVSGPHTNAGIARLMREADAFVLASDYETQSIVIVEALLSGLPCIATRCGGPEDLLAGAGRGLLVPLHDRAALGDAMKKLLLSGPEPFAARQLRARSAHVEFGRVGERLIALYHELVSP